MAVIVQNPYQEPPKASLTYDKVHMLIFRIDIPKTDSATPSLFMQFCLYTIDDNGHKIFQDQIHNYSIVDVDDFVLQKSTLGDTFPAEAFTHLKSLIAYLVTDAGVFGGATLT